MTPQTAAELAGKAAQLNVFYVLCGLFVIVGAFAFLATLGERALGLDLKRFVNNVERQADENRVWAGVVCFVVVPACIFSIVLWVGLR